jgi:hypothetical protein
MWERDIICTYGKVQQQILEKKTCLAGFFLVFL